MRRILFFCLVLLSVAAFAVNPNATLLVVDGQPVTVGEFQYIYGKNNAGTTLDKRSLEEYKDLFINFKLKVAEAERQGLDTAQSFINELQGYRAQLARPYLTSRYAHDSLLYEAYQRRMVNPDVWHIAVKAPENASAEDTLAAYAKIQEARRRITGYAEVKPSQGGRKPVRRYAAPVPFDVVADQLSDDPSVKENHGHIGWVGVFQMYYNFENACFNTPVGEVSEPVRTPFGYHIVRVADRRKDLGEYHIAHIMLFTQRYHDDDTAEQRKQVDSINAAVKIRIDSLAARLAAGDKFEELAKQYSEDHGTSYRGGDLGNFGTGVIPEFEDALLALPDDQQYTPPVRTKYGWHILRRISHRQWGTFDEEKKALMERMERSDRQAAVAKYFVDSLRNIYGAVGNDSITDKMLISRYDSELESRFPDFHNLMQEYHDGILLFDISNREVWDKATQDTAGLRNYFETHSSDYKWQQPHFKGRIIYCKDKQTLKLAMTMAKNAAVDSLDRYLNARLNDSVQYVRLHRVLADPADSTLTGSSLLRETVFKKQPKVATKYLAKVANDNRSHYSAEGYPYVIVVGKLVDNPETYSDIRGPVTADYQEYLEKTWIETLRNTHVWNLDPLVWDAMTKE